MAKQQKKRKKSPSKTTKSTIFETKQSAPKNLMSGSINTGTNFNSAPKRSAQSGRKR